MEMPQTQLFPVVRVVKPARPFPPLSLLHLIPCSLPDVVLDESATRHGQPRGKDSIKVVRSRRDVALVVPEDKMENFIDEFNDLLNTEVEFEFEPIDIGDFGELQVSAKDMMFLDKLFV